MAFLIRWAHYSPVAGCAFPTRLLVGLALTQTGVFLGWMTSNERGQVYILAPVHFWNVALWSVNNQFPDRSFPEIRVSSRLGVPVFSLLPD